MRYAIERALRAKHWGTADRHADELLERTAPEPLSYSSHFARRGRLLAQIGRGAAAEREAAELADLRATAAATGLRMDALGKALRH